MNKSNINVGQVWMIAGEDDPSKWKLGEIGKSRPMLVIGVHGHICNCIPITSSDKSKEYNKIYHELPNKDILLLTQVRTVSKVDFKHFMYSIDSKEQMDINLKIASMFIDPSANWSKPVSKRPDYVKNYKHSKHKHCNLSKKVKLMISNDYCEMPMNSLLLKYHKYNLSKQDVYSIMLEN